MSKEESMEEFVVSGVTLNQDEAKITVKEVPNEPGVAGLLFTRLAEVNINVDMIVQSSSMQGTNNISFTVNKKNLNETKIVLEKIQPELSYREVIYDSEIAKVSAVGAGMQSHPGVAARTFSCLGKLGINIDIISTSEIKISCIVSKRDGVRAVRAIHQEFNLDKIS